VNEPSNSRSILCSGESNGFMHQLFLHKHKQSKKTKDCVFTLDLMDNLMIDQPLIDETIPQTDHSLYVFMYYLPICFLP
jgi:hypothetical protein